MARTPIHPGEIFADELGGESAFPQSAHCGRDSSIRHWDQTEKPLPERPEGIGAVASVTLRTWPLSMGMRKENRPRSSARDKGFRTRSNSVRLWPDASLTAMATLYALGIAIAGIGFLGHAKVTRERSGVRREYPPRSCWARARPRRRFREKSSAGRGRRFPPRSASGQKTRP